jgi:hypothetical protein
MMDDRLFIAARDRFFNSLPVKERSRLPSCDSAEKLLSAVNNMEPVKKAINQQTRSLLLGYVSPLIDVLRPYLDSINLIVATNSDIASPVWGAVRLVLEVRLSDGTRVH